MAVTMNIRANPRTKAIEARKLVVMDETRVNGSP